MNTNGMIKVVIADESNLIRANMVSLLSYAPEITVSGEARNRQDTIQLIKDFSPDVLLMDLQQPVLDPLNAMRLFSYSPRNRPILILNEVNDRRCVAEVIAMDSWGYFAEEKSPEKIIDIIRQAVQCYEQWQYSTIPAIG